MDELLVLIVDDEIGMRLGVERTLKNFTISIEGFTDKVCFNVVSAETGSEAINILTNQKIDLLILDYKLPDMQGLEILEMVMKEKKDLLTIMITAYASIEVAISATKIGAFDFLAKPFTPEELRNTISKTAKHIYVTRKARKLEKEKKQVRFQFISVLAHELKSPLSAVENYLRIMDEKIAGNDITKYENSIERSLLRIDGMRKLINDLLDLTRIESGQKKRELTTINISVQADLVIESVMLEAKKRNIEINKNYNGNILINADLTEISIIFNNLLTNAVKYNRENGKVFLTITKENDNVKIICEDTGIGMSKEELNKLFDEFVRIKNDKTKNILGSGLGLSILNKIVKLYDGNIDVTSEPDKGTKFTLLLKDIKEIIEE